MHNATKKKTWKQVRAQVETWQMVEQAVKI